MRGPLQRGTEIACALLAMTLTSTLSAQPGSFHTRTNEEAQPCAEDALGADVLELIGFRQMTDQIAIMVRGTANVEQSPADPEIVGVIFARALRRGFEAERLYEVSTRAFCGRATDARLKQSLEWLSAPLVKRMQQLERHQQASVDQEDFRAYITALEERPPSRERVELFARLDIVSGTSEAAVEIEAAMMRAMLEGMNPSLPDGTRMTAAEIEALVDAGRPEFARSARDHVQQTLLYTYRGISDEELGDYIAHLESDAGLWLSQAILKSLFEAMEACARASGEAIAESIRELAKTKA